MHIRLLEALAWDWQICFHHILMVQASHKANDNDSPEQRGREIDYLLMEEASKSHPRGTDAGRRRVMVIFCNLTTGS